VVSVDAKTNSLTVQTPSGDETTYNPNLTKTMTAESTVYRQEQREIAPGDRIQFSQADSTRGIRKGDLGTVMAISDANDLNVTLDKGTVLQLNAEQARHREHGYAVESIKPGAPERVLFTQEAAVNEREAALLSRQGRELNLFTSDGSVSNNQGRQNQVTLPQQQQIETQANVIAPEPVQNEIRRSLGRSTTAMSLMIQKSHAKGFLMFLPSFRSPSIRVLLIATVAAATIPLTAFGAPNIGLCAKPWLPIILSPGLASSCSRQTTTGSHSKA
jgi:hypothetical protein